MPLDFPQCLLLSTSCFCGQLAVVVNQRLPKATPRETQLPQSPTTVRLVTCGLGWLPTAGALGTFPGQQLVPVGPHGTCRGLTGQVFLPPGLGPWWAGT